MLTDFRTSFSIEKMLKSLITLKFHTRSIGCRHCDRICSEYLPLTRIRAHRCVCNSLIAGKVLYLSAGQRSHRARDTVRFLEQLTTITSHFISSDQTASTLNQFTTIACLPVLCVESVNELE